MSKNSQLQNESLASRRRIPSPWVAGPAWMGLLAALGLGYLTIQFAWRWGVLEIEDAAFLGRDQFWSLLALVAVGFVVGTIAVTLRRARASYEAASS